MIYFLLWILLGSLSLNILYIKKHLKKRVDPKASLDDYWRGFLFGIILGPLGLPVSYLLDKFLTQDKSKKESYNPEDYRGP